MAQYDPKILKELFSDVAFKAGLTLEHADSVLLAEEINTTGEGSSIMLTGPFLYEAYRKIKAAVEKGEESITFNASYINRVSRYLDVLGFSQYRAKKEKDSDKEEARFEKKSPATIIGKNINNFEGDVDNITINNN